MIDAGCVCATSVDNVTDCATSHVSCVACSSDAECTTHLGKDGLCVDVSGCHLCNGEIETPNTDGMACVPKGCA